MRLLHKRCRNNRDAVMAAGKYACFFCGGRYPASAIAGWIDGGRTALCPCDCDAVLPDGDDMPVSDELLRAMCRRWFPGPALVMSRSGEVIS